MATKKAKIVVVRSGQSGVHAGELVSVKGDTVTLRNAIRLWRFVPNKVSGQLTSVSEVAAYGINRTDSRARTGARLAEHVILGVCEVATVTSRDAVRSLMVDP